MTEVYTNLLTPTKGRSQKSKRLGVATMNFLFTFLKEFTQKYTGPSKKGKLQIGSKCSEGQLQKVSPQKMFIHENSKIRLQITEGSQC